MTFSRRPMPDLPSEPPARDPLSDLVDEKFLHDRLAVLLAAGLRPISVAIITLDGMAEIKRRRGRRAVARRALIRASVRATGAPTTSL